MALYPLLRLVLTRDKARRLQQRRDYTIRLRQRRKEFSRLQLEVQREAKLYRQIIIERLAAMGYSWRTRRGDNDPDDTARRRRKTTKVKIEITRFNEHAIWYKLHVRSRKLFGSRNELPYRTYVTDLVKEETCEELSFALQRRVTSKHDDPHKGAWLIVHRSEYSGLLPELVRWRHLLEYYPPDVSRGPILIGIGENNSIHETTLDDCPHVLIAGASRSGKSNILNCILAGLVWLADRDQVRFILADPKKVELAFYERLPHLERPVIYDINETIKMLEEVNQIIETRTDLMKGRAKELSAFNKRYPNERMHRLVVVIEEMASLWETNRERDHVHRLIKRISSMGRACGVNLIVCTQLPVVDVIPSVIRVNMWLRIAGRVMNWRESQVILATSDAAAIPEKPRGRMCYAKDASTYQIQAPLIEDEDIQWTINIACGRAAGLIELQGAEPAIIPDALARHIWLSLRGQLSPKTLEYHYRQYGITSRMLKDFLEAVLRSGIPGFEVVRHDGGDLFIVPLGDDQQTWQAARLQLPFPAPLLMLPAPERPDPADPAPKPEPEPRIGFKLRTDAEEVSRFLDERCTVDPKARTWTRDLYAAYAAWCDHPVGPSRFGEYLNHAGFSRGRKFGQRYWAGIRLKEDD